MKSVGIRELKEHATEILRHLREEGQAYEITYCGRAVPVGAPAPDAVDERFWHDWRTLANEIADVWPTGVSALDAVIEDRRDL